MKNISVAIGNLERPDQWALLKATAIAERCGARLTLLHTFSLPYPLAGSSYRSTAQIVREASESRRQQLVALTARFGIRYARLEYAIVWDVPPAAAIVRHVLRAKPDLLVADSHRHGRLGRWLLNNTDWELIRGAPCPLWFVKSPQLPKQPRLLAAVDPQHADSAHSGLDAAILMAARKLHRELQASLAITHVLEPGTETAAHDAVARLARQQRLGAAPRVYGKGDPAVALPRLAAAGKADAVIMGALARRTRAPTYIGGTAERVIDKLRCDIIVIKPPGFVTAFSARPALRL